jgi:hypothetical protein
VDIVSSDKGVALIVAAHQDMTAKVNDVRLFMLRVPVCVLCTIAKSFSRRVCFRGTFDRRKRSKRMTLHERGGENEPTDKAKI